MVDCFLISGFILCYIWTRIQFYGILLDNLYKRSLKAELTEEISQDLASFEQKATARVEDKANEIFTINSLLSDFRQALDAEGKKPQKERDWATLNRLRQRVRDVFEKNKLNRTAAILLARFENEIQNVPPHGYAPAIRQLEEFLDAKSSANEVDRDYADVMYNRACYAALSSAADTEPVRKERHKTRALQSLRESIRIARSNIEEAQTDPDLDSLRGDPEFRKMIPPCTHRIYDPKRQISNPKAQHLPLDDHLSYLSIKSSHWKAHCCATCHST